MLLMHGRHHRVSLQPAFGFHLLRAHQHDGVAVDDAAARVDEDGAVTVAVVGDAKTVLSLGDDRGELLGGRRAAVQVDVSTVGFAASGSHVETEILKQPGSHGRCCSVGAIDSDAHASETRRLRQDAFQVGTVVVPIVDLLDDLRVANRRRPRLVVHDRLDVLLERLGEFSPAPEKTLMPLSSNGLCDAEMTTPAV
jgi:hypothetical protein